MTREGNILVWGYMCWAVFAKMVFSKFGFGIAYFQIHVHVWYMCDNTKIFGVSGEGITRR